MISRSIPSLKPFPLWEVLKEASSSAGRKGLLTKIVFHDFSPIHREAKTCPGTGTKSYQSKTIF
jgi:hypothetical protein